MLSSDVVLRLLINGGDARASQGLLSQGASFDAFSLFEAFCCVQKNDRVSVGLLRSFPIGIRVESVVDDALYRAGVPVERKRYLRRLALMDEERMVGL